MRVCTYVYICIDMCIYVHIHMRVHKYVCICVCRYIYVMYVYVDGNMAVRLITAVGPVGYANTFEHANFPPGVCEKNAHP